MLASEWGQRAVISSLVANVATAYFQLRALDSQLEISKRTLASPARVLKLTQFLESHGFELRTRRKFNRNNSFYTASEAIPDLERQIQPARKSASASCLAKIPVPLPAVRPLRSSPCPSPFPLVCLQNCSNVARTFDRQKKSSWQPTRKLVLPKLPSFPVSPSLGREARKQRAESVHQRTLPDLVRRPQRLAACLSSRSSPIGD